MASTQGRSIFISAGDISGDHHAGGLIQRFKKNRPDLQWFGLGGRSMEVAGCSLLSPPERETVMGFRRVLRRLPHYFSLLAKIAHVLRTNRPEAVILVDFPGLNLRIARIAKSLGIPVIYFICPQLWAWAPWRVKSFAALVDLALVIFPFEETYFQEHGVKTRYVGHPVCDSQDSATDAAPCEEPILALLPGSRKQELESNLPVMLKTAAVVLKKHPDLQPVVSHYDESYLALALKTAKSQGIEIVTVRGGMRSLARNARLCLVCSGTATLEVAFSEAPMTVVYRTSRLAAKLAPLLLTVPYICQVNLMAGFELVPEVLLHDDDPGPILARALPLIPEGPEREEMVEGLKAFRRRHFRPGALDRTGESIAQFLEPGGAKYS